MQICENYDIQKCLMWNLKHLKLCGIKLITFYILNWEDEVYISNLDLTNSIDLK